MQDIWLSNDVSIKASPCLRNNNWRRTPTSSLSTELPFLLIIIEVYEKVNAISIIQTRDDEAPCQDEFDSFCKASSFLAAKPSHNYSKLWRENRKSQFNSEE